MLRNTLRAIVVLIVFCLPAVAMSQDMPAGKWWHMPLVVKKLNLAEPQIAQLDEAFYKSRLNLIRLKSDLEREQFELETLIENKSLNENAALEQYKKLEQARVKLGIERFRFVLSIRKIVGYQRFQELMAFKRLRQQRQRGAQGKGLSQFGK